MELVIAQPAPGRPREVASVFGGPCALRFMTTKEYQDFKAANRDLYMRFYHQQVRCHGIWAGNQGRFLASPAEFNDWDSQQDWTNYRIWLARQPKETA